MRWEFPDPVDYLTSDEWARLVLKSGATGMAKEILANSRGSVDKSGLVIWVSPDVARLVFHDGDITDAADWARVRLSHLMVEDAYIHFEIDNFGLSGTA